MIITNDIVADFVCKIGSAKNFHECFKVLTKKLEELGFDGVLYTFIPLTIKNQKPIMLVSENYGNNYLQYYLDNDFSKYDMVINHSIERRITYFNWFDYINNNDVCNENIRVLEEAKKFGLQNGISFILFSSPHVLAGASLVCKKSDDYFKEVCEVNKETAQILCEFFHNSITAKRYHTEVFIEPIISNLNYTKLSLLQGLSQGNNIKTISSQLNISEKYAQNLLGKIRVDLGCSSRDELMFLVGSLPIIHK